MENHLVRVHQGEQLIMIKRLYYYSVAVFLLLIVKCRVYDVSDFHRKFKKF